SCCRFKPHRIQMYANNFVAITRIFLSSRSPAFKLLRVCMSAFVATYSRNEKSTAARGRGARASDNLKSLVRQSLELRVDLGHGPVLDLSRPGRIYRHVVEIFGGDAQIEREVGHVQRLPVAAESGTRRKEQALWCAVIDESFEIAKLSDDLAGLVADDDLVRVVGRPPQIVVTVDNEPVRAVDAVDEDGRCARRAAAHRNLHDRVVARIGDE